MSDKENLPEKKLSENEDKNLEKKVKKEQPETLQPADQIVEKPSEEKGNEEKNDAIEDAMVDEASTSEKKGNTTQSSPEAALHTDEEDEAKAEAASQESISGEQKSEDTSKKQKSEPEEPLEAEKKLAASQPEEEKKPSKNDISEGEETAAKPTSDASEDDKIQEDKEEVSAPKQKSQPEEPLEAEKKLAASQPEEEKKPSKNDISEGEETAAKPTSEASEDDKIQEDKEEASAPKQKSESEEPLEAEKKLAASQPEEEKKPSKNDISEGEETAAKSTSEASEDDEEEDEKEEDSAPKTAKSEFENAVAEDSEDETTGERHGIDKKDYHAMSKDALADELEKLIKKEKVQAIKEHVEEIRAEFNAKFDEEVEEKKEEFLADGGNIIDFHYSTPLKKRFNSLYFDYKEKRNKYYQQLKQDLNKNLERRLGIIEELKGLLDVEENINTTYKHFKELQDRWKTAGAIPRDKYNTVWNTYHHHVENFYDFLHLNREFRDLDFKHNLEQKLKIINRAEELTQEDDTNRAFRELQMLHKMWKEDLGPVEREFREDIWQKFSDATKKIHDKRQEYFEQLEEKFEKNFEKKEEIIEKLRQIADTDYTSHKQWQQKIKEVETLREEFFNAGKVPRNVSDQTWKKFKEVVRTFNRNKNSFYKNQKKGQYKNLEQKQELVKIAEENKDSEDFKATTSLMKKIQNEWKQIGHVPRKDSDKIWKKFKAACNHYFDRLHATRDDENKEENEAFDKKKDLLDQLKNAELSGDRKKDLPVIKGFIEKWKEVGRVPQTRRYIEGKFNKALDQAFDKLDMDKKQTEMLKYENKVQALEDADDTRKINNEHYFLTKKIEETKAEIRQLENNLQFFAHVADDNPVVQEVQKNIQNQKDQLKIWKEKLEQVNKLY